MRKAGAALAFAGLVALCAVSYLGARFGVDALGLSTPSQAISRPGIDAIVAGPTPKAPVAAPAPSTTGNQDAGLAVEASSASDTVSTDSTAGEVLAPSSGGGSSDGAASGNQAPAGQDSSSPPPASESESADKEEPPIVRYP